jgi:hypothetical protein
MEPVDPLFFSFQQAVAGRYSIDREIGRGGMGVVYLAREVHLDRPVAIKLLPPERAAQRTLRDRFLREARLAAKLSHPNIIPIHSVEEIDGFVFFVMAFVEGETLADRVRTRGPLPANEGARVLREVAWALAYAHGQGLVHRDVKPDNILLEESSGRVLVADFGIAAAAGDSADGISGTPEFMSPEQALGTALDARSDLYGLGATAFYMYSGRFPFEGKTATEVLAKQVTEPAPPLSSLGLAVPRKLAALIDRCLAKAPAQRPESANALAEQLGVALERRREMPPALRAFVNRNSRLDGPGTLLSAGFLSVGFFVSAAMIFGTGWVGAYVGLVAVAALAVAAPFFAFVDSARNLLDKGFTHRDATSAYDAAIEHAREEMAVELPSRVKLRRVLGGLAAGGLITAALGLGLLSAPTLGRALADLVGHVMVTAFLMFAVVGGFVGLFSFMGYAILSARVEEPDGTFWAKLWKSRIGRAAFALAARFSQRHSVSALTHRATELSLGMAAEQLFESLPKETRRELKEVPGLLRRLQDDAQELRKRHDGLHDALAESGDSSSPEYAEVRAMRDTLHAKLSDAVGALETIRLNLLRLHAGGLSVASVTTHLNIAAEVSEEVERLIAAHSEVDRVLKFPRTPASTPV